MAAAGDDPERRQEMDPFADEPADAPVSLFGWEGSIEAANYDTELLAGACPLDLYDLHDDGREPW